VKHRFNPAEGDMTEHKLVLIGDGKRLVVFCKTDNRYVLAFEEDHLHIHSRSCLFRQSRDIDFEPKPLKTEDC